MQTKLTIPERLKDLRVEQGLTLEQLAEKTGLSAAALGRYEIDDGPKAVRSVDISSYALCQLAEVYGVSIDYLLGRTENKNPANTEVQALRLRDEAIEVLRSGKFNHRLLSEILCHKEFERLMVDAEIFVDRIADQRINDLNVLLEGTRKQVMEQYVPGENDLNMRTLELAQITSTEYFSGVVGDDLSAILRDIRAAHGKDATTADEASPAAEAAKRIQEAVNFEGSPQEKQARAYLAGLSIDYDALTKEEFVTLIGILQKADINRIHQVRSQRGRSSPYPPHGHGKGKKRR